jgi:hypothetical protein
MSILQLPTPLAAQDGLRPATKKMVTTDNLATITTAGYLNAVNLESYPISSTDIIEVLYNYTASPAVTSTFGLFTPSISNGVITLNQFTGSTTSVQTNTINTFASGAGIIAAKGTATSTGNVATINQQTGVITTPALTTAAGGTYVITLTNSFLKTTSVFLTSLQGGTSTSNNITITATPGAGTGTITITNENTVTALNGTLIIGFAVF